MRPLNPPLAAAREARHTADMAWVSGQLIETLDKNDRLTLAAVLQAAGSGVRLLLLNGKEQTVSERQILHATRDSQVRVGDRDAAQRQLEDHNQRRQARADAIDLAELHAVVVDEDRAIPLGELAGLLCEPGDEVGAAALLRRLYARQHYFRLRKEGFVPVPPAEVEQQIARDRAEAERRAAEQALVHSLRASVRQPVTDRSAWDLGLTHAIDAIVDVAVMADESAHHERLTPILAQAGLGNHTALVQWLERLGVLAPDENLLLRKHQVPTAFSTEVVQAATQLVTPAIDLGAARRDLTHLPTWAIDNPGTRDRDDAFSLVVTPDGHELFIHIADAASYIVPDSVLDREARRRGITLYFPDQRLPMLPPTLSEERLSLDVGEPHAAMTVRVVVAADGAVGGIELFPSTVRVTAATDYPTADGLLAGDDAQLREAVAVAEKLRAVRRSKGALFIPRTEIDVKIAADGTLVLERHGPDSRCRLLVEELMIWCNHLAAQWAADHRVPFLFRRQDPPAEPFPTMEVFDPVVFYRCRRLLRRSSVDTTPALHAALGVSAYAQISSPIRRYADLLLMRQLHAALAGRAPLNAEELSQQLLMADEAIRLGESLMQQRERFFLLKYLRQEMTTGRDTTPGVVVDPSGNQTVVYLSEYDVWQDCPAPRFAAVAGQKVRVKILSVDPPSGGMRCVADAPWTD